MTNEQQALLEMPFWMVIVLSLVGAVSGEECRADRAGAGGVDKGAARAQLGPAHAQRVFEITGDGDQGLITLAACQAYAKEVSTPK